MDFRDYWRIIRRQWIWSASIFALMMVVFFSYSVVVEKQMYRSTCQLGILTPQWDERIFRETSSIVPPVAGNFEMKVERLDQEYLARPAARRLIQEIEKIERPLLAASDKDKPAKTKGARFYYPFQNIVAEIAKRHGVKPRSIGGQNYYTIADIREIPDPKVRAKALEALDGSPDPEEEPSVFASIIPQPLKEVQERKKIVWLTVTYDGAVEAEMLANAIGQGAMDRDNADTLSNREGEAAAITKHIGIAKDRIQEYKDKLEKFLRANNIKELEADIADLRNEIKGNESAIRAKQAEKLKLEHELQNPLSMTLLGGSFMQDTPRINEMRTALSGLEQQKTVLLLDLKEVHPDVKRLQVQIERVQEALEEEVRREESRLQEKSIERLNGIHDALRLLSDEIGELERQKVDSDAKLRALSDRRFEHDDLMRGLNQAGEQMDRLRQKLDAVELAKSLLKRDDKDAILNPLTGNISLLKPATTAVPVAKQSSHAMGFMIIMAVAVSVCIAYLVEYADTRIRTEEDVRKHLNIPVLAKVEKRARGEKVCLTDLPPRDAFAEIFNTVSTVITSAAKDLGIKVFVVSSTVAEEGKTTITVNLGVALARKGLRVILVDGDLRRPQLHDMLGTDNSTGLSTILEGRSQAAEQLSEIADEPPPLPGPEAYLKSTSVENLRVLPSGPTPHDPITLLESQRMKDLVEELRSMADFVLIDTPPIFHVGDVLTLTPLVDANLFVVGAFEVKQHEVTWAKHLLSNVEANILGAFLNKEVIESKSYYYYYRYYKGYRYRN